MLCDVYSGAQYIHKNDGGLEMKEYVITLVSVSIICGIIQTLAPESAGDALRKYVKLASSLCLLCMILAPVSSFVVEVRENGLDIGEKWFDSEKAEEKYEEVYKESIGQYTAAELEEICEKEAAERFGIERSIFDISVLVVSENENLGVDRAVLSLHKTTDKNDPRDIAEFISSMLSCECEIIYT